VEALHASGYRVLASQADPARGATPVPLTAIDFRERVALLFGNEHAGVSERALALADGAFRIGMLGFVESLNLSVAAAICAFHARRELERLAAEAGNPARFALSPERQRALYAEWLRQSVRAAEKILGEAEPPPEP
jgi:tRNA (guanosine-2'-O-)-methyltransferase